MIYPTGQKKGKTFAVYPLIFAEWIKSMTKYLTRGIIAMFYLI